MITGYEPIATLLGIPLEVVIIIFTILVIWDLIWRGIALWKAGKNNQLVWFIALLIVNSLGVLPIVYLLFFQKKQAVISKIVKKTPKKRKR